MTLRKPISLLLALLLFTGSVAAFACDSYCAPSAPLAAEATASGHDAHAHHHVAAPAGAGDTDGVVAGGAGHPPQCLMSAETPRTPRVVRSANDGPAAPLVSAQADGSAPARAAELSAIAPSPPDSPPHQHVLPLRI